MTTMYLCSLAAGFLIVVCSQCLIHRLEALKIYMPNIRLRKHNADNVEAALHRAQNASVNHFNEGLICQGDDYTRKYPPGYILKEKKAVIGKGIKDFELASDIILNLRMLDRVPWAEFVCPQGQSVTKGTVCATLVKCYQLIWAFNPCRVVCRDRSVATNHGKTVYSQLAISTLEGHLIEGEEKFRVEFDTTDGNEERDTNSVTISLLSYTRGAGVLGAIAMPLIRPLQDYFFNDVVRSLQSLIDDSRSTSI